MSKINYLISQLIAWVKLIFNLLRPYIAAVYCTIRSIRRRHDSSRDVPVFLRNEEGRFF